MIRIAITAAAFGAIAATLPLGQCRPRDRRASAGFGVDAAIVDRLTAMRGPGERSYSDVILRLVELETGQRS